MSSIVLTGNATINGKSDTLFTDSLALPEEASLPLSLFERFFGSPDVEATVENTAGSLSVLLSAKIGSFTPSFKVPFALPSLIAKWIADVEGAGYPVELVIEAKLS